MKRFAGIFSILVLLSVMITGCGDNSQSEFVGTWKAQSIIIEGVTLDLEEYAQLQGAQQGDDTDIIMTLSADGKYTINAFSKKAEGTWKEEDGQAVVTSQGQTQTAALENGKLSMGQGSNTIVFVRQNT